MQLAAAGAYLGHPRVDLCCNCFTTALYAKMCLGVAMTACQAWCEHCSDSALSKGQLQRGFDSQAVKTTPLAGLVECLVKIGGISDAQETLHQHLPNQVCT